MSLALCACLNPATFAEENKPAETLYLQLGHAELDPTRVYKVRGASLNRSDVQITLEDGTIAFTQDVMGHITGAFFEGEGEVLLTPPNAVERKSMGLFTGMAILEERFATAYFRFNDDAASELQPDLRETDEKREFVQRWGPTARNLAEADAMRLLMTFSQLLPSSDPSPSGNEGTDNPPDRFLHARLQGATLGVFDVYFDSTGAEQVQAGQVKAGESGESYYDVWTSFASTLETPHVPSQGPTAIPERTNQGRIAVRQYAIDVQVLPPKQIQAQARIQCEVRVGGARALLFELSRFLRIESVQLDGHPVEFIHNPSLEGTQLSRQGNDLVAIVLPSRTTVGRKMELEFVYGGEVLAEAGNGLLYVGARGTWYPNRGMEMADFDLQFSYPQGWTLVATGKPTPIPAGRTALAGQQSSHWVSERPIPLAGFNLGKYREVTTRAGDVGVETYASQGVEKDFPSGSFQVLQRNPLDGGSRPPQLVAPSRPSPAQNEISVSESAAAAIQYFAARFGPFPFSHLALTQMPGRDSQGWPGLIFLSSYAFLNDEERRQLHFQPYRMLIQHSIPAHEVAHQWWGDLVVWRTYRDQWLSEGLANYCALTILQEKNPAGFREVMEKYRTDLLEKNKNGVSPVDAGPVTLGTRLLSSRFPDGYEAISYGRGTWLFYMLRTMLKDASTAKAVPHQTGNNSGVDEPFVRALRKIRERYEGKTINTRELLDVFAEELPPALRYEGKNSLDWFLDGWVNGTALPKLELKNVKFTPKAAGLTVSGTILQKDAPPDLVTSVPVYAVIAGRQPLLLGRVFADGEESSFHISGPAGVHKVVLDPYNTVLTSPK